MSPESNAEKSWVPLTPRERRVLGVLVEKAKTTPEYYPLTIAALVSGCNQKSNRDPVTNYDTDDLDEILQGLRKKGATVLVEGGGRVVRWKHTLYDWLKVNKVELAVIAELLLRGPQTEGDLRARASRMEPFPDLAALQVVLESLTAKGLVVYLSPPGVKRGVVVTHGLYPPDEAERVRQAFVQQPGAYGEEDDRPARGGVARAETHAPGWIAEVAALRAELEAVRGTVQALESEVRELKKARGFDRMSMPEAEPTEPQPEQTVEAPARREGWTLVALIAGDGCEPPASLSEREALGAWCAVAALWHPSLLARAKTLPRIESVESPSPPEAREIRVIAAGTLDRLPSGYQTQAADAGSVVIEGGEDRAALVRAIQERLGAVGTPETSEAEDMRSAAADFLALGTAHWFLKDLTIAMGHADALDHESLNREVLTGADAWQAGDRPTALNRLRAGFELLTQARERFYPVDAYIIDLCLLDPAMPGGVLADALAAHAAVTFLAPAQAVENQANRDPERMAALREAISEGWADVAGGAYAEVDEPLLPLESVLWQFRKGGAVYRAHLDERNVETLARRRFGLYPQLPQLARRHGFRFGLHLGFDAGRFPLRPEAKRLWESHDGSNLESLLRPPLGVDRAVSGPQLPWRLAKTMRDDHVATLPFVHWPNAAAPWYTDLRRAAGYSPVLARWVTLNDYFHLTDRPFESFRPELDLYATPYLAQAVARQDPEPISRRAAHARLRARLDALAVTRALALGLAAAPPENEGPTVAQLEESLETGALDVARGGLDTQEPVWADALAAGIAGRSDGGRSGYLVINPLGVARRAAVLLPDAALDLRPEGPLRAAQFTDEGVWGIADLPAFGYAWVPRAANVDVPPATARALSARERVLKNESLRVEIDKTSGGLRSICGVSEETARLGQQLVIHGLVGADGAPASSRMQADRVEVEYAGPALVQAVSSGTLLDPRDGGRLASFHQRFRLWSGRPVLEVDVTLSDLDPAWLERLGKSDPWSHYLACRWAWPDPNSMLRRTALLAPELTESDRPETPDAFDISTRRQRTALLFGGLAHHRRHGARMLDTLLIAGGETARAFRFGVVLDQEHPFQAALDFVAPAHVVAVETGPPATGPTGWLYHVDHKAVAVTRLEYLDATADERGWGVVLHVLETSGHAARCRLRCFRSPTWARQTDMNGELIVDLPIDGDAVLIDLTPHELARVEVTLG